MAKITSILVPLDGSKASNTGLKMAISVAEQFGATLTGLYVMKGDSHSEFSTKPTVNEYEREEGERVIRDAQDRADAKGIPFKGKITTGDAGYNITKMANDKKRGFSLIVLGSRGRGKLRGFFMGSVSNYVVQSSSIPVMIAK